MPQSVACLMGPTATGKTDLALSLANLHPFEIVSVDSAQVYRGMDIGTAKPAPETRLKYPHHLVDIHDPSEPYSAADFRRDAITAIESIRTRGKVPLLVGGTMLYFKALRDGLAELPPADPAVRERITQLASVEGWPAVHAKLAEVDPDSARRINPNDPQRLQRALEIFEVSGRSMSELHGAQVTGACPYDLCQIAIMPPDRAMLHERIEARFLTMLRSGLVEETRALMARGDLAPEMPSIKAVGYRQVWAHLAGDYGFDEMVMRGVAATRQLAKRQFTWLRSWPAVHVFETADVAPVLKILESDSILD